MKKKFEITSKLNKTLKSNKLKDRDAEKGQIKLQSELMTYMMNKKFRVVKEIEVPSLNKLQGF